MYPVTDILAQNHIIAKPKSIDSKASQIYNPIMQKLILGILFVVTLAVTACGVKSELARHGDGFPRNYPVY